MKTPKLNLHIHSKFSDGFNSIFDIVNEALKQEMDYICITDHFSNSWKADVIPTLNSPKKIQLYLDQIDKAKQTLNKKNEKLLLLKGIEVDITSSKPYIIQTLNPYQFDLILFEYLESYDGLHFIQSIIDYWREIKKSSRFPLLLLAHFDPGYFIHGNLDPLVHFIKRNDIIFEFNSSYSHCYSVKNKVFFEKLKKNEIFVSIGCDSHDLHTISAIEGPYEMIKYYQLEKNLKNLINQLDWLGKT